MIMSDSAAPAYAALATRKRTREAGVITADPRLHAHVIAPMKPAEAEEGLRALDGPAAVRERDARAARLAHVRVQNTAKLETVDLAWSL